MGSSEGDEIKKKISEKGESADDVSQKVNHDAAWNTKARGRFLENLETFRARKVIFSRLFFKDWGVHAWNVLCEENLCSY